MKHEPSSLDFLRAIYLNEELPLSVRMRAASVALPFEMPKLSAVAVMNGDDFGSRMDRAIARSRGEMKVIEHQPEVVEHDASELER
jgi:hypothetical protein